jgi:phosphoglycolate phosphatase
MAFDLNPACNICGNARFATYRGRPAERCEKCGSKARHRVAMLVYRSLVFPLAAHGGKVLHFAPEVFLYPLFSQAFGAGYVTADHAPERYPHANAVQVTLPQGLSRFADGAFDAVIHNHVLEHVPGHWRDHVAALMRVVKPGGVMVFTVPGPYQGHDTIEGGEHLPSDAERLEKFLQEDHFKLFGRDFAEGLYHVAGAQLLPDAVTDAMRAEVQVRAGKSPVFILRKLP